MHATHDELTKWLAAIPRPRLRKALRNAEEDVIGRIHSRDVLALEAAYRLAVAWLYHRGCIPAIGQLPARLIGEMYDRPGRKLPRSRKKPTLVDVEYALLVERLEAEVRATAECWAGGLEPVVDVVFDYDEELERARRVEEYRQQWAKLRKQFEPAGGDPLRRGPYARPVYCVEARRWFASARKAARWVNHQNAGRAGWKPICRADIRTAVKRRTKCAGFAWRVDAKADARLVATGKERRVRCVGRDDLPPFGSIAEAARWAGCSQSCLSAALAGNDGVVKTRRGEFAFCEVGAEDESVLSSPAPAGVVEQMALFA